MVLKFNTLKNMNMPVYFKGLSSVQLFGTFIVSVLAFILFDFLAIMFYVPLFMLIRKIARENKKGNPDFADSFLVLHGSKKEIADVSKVYRMLKK